MKVVLKSEQQKFNIFIGLFISVTLLHFLAFFHFSLIDAFFRLLAYYN